jgi:mannose-1-phosphate guanylyltransferase
MNHSHYVIIMAGGVGSRFWPISRTDYPKQFLDILGTGQTLIQQTFRRFEKIVPRENIFVVTASEYVALVKKQLPQMAIENILAEPERKNTAPCIAFASFKLLKLDPNASVIVTPADHLILGEEEFNTVCREGLDFIEHNEALLTLGIKPTHPNTGYGYIRYEVKEEAAVFPVREFREKPALDQARAFLKSGDYLWNSGIFIWKVRDIISAYKKFLPMVYDLFETDKLVNFTEDEVIRDIFSRCPSISIDFSIMEKAENVWIIPSSFEWSDLGTWNSAWENMDKDNSDNALAVKNVFVTDASNCVVHAGDEKLVVIQGLHDYIIVDTKDVLLICQKEKEQSIKEYVFHVRKKTGEKYLQTPLVQKNDPVFREVVY